MVAADWFLYTNKEHDFSILFPVKPMVQTKSMDSELGAIEQHTAYSIFKDSAAVEFQVISSKYEMDIFDGQEPDTVKQLIQSTIINEMLTYLDGQIVYESPSEINGIPSHWFLMKFKNNLSLKTCLIWDKSHLISLMHYSEYNLRLDSRSERFFNSFILLSRK